MTGSCRTESPAPQAGLDGNTLALRPDQKFNASSTQCCFLLIAMAIVIDNLSLAIRLNFNGRPGEGGALLDSAEICYVA